MLLSDVEGYVRQDLFDPVSATERWQTSDIDRAIDKAVDRYAQYYPNIAFADMAGEAFARTYPYPTPANPSYPVWWIERILYPLQVYGSYFLSPTAGPTPTAGAAGNVNGTVQYAMTFLSQGGETPPSPLTSITVANKQVALSNIQVGPASPAVPNIATNTVIGRNVYRTLNGGSVLYLITTIKDNVTTTYTDNALDSSISSAPVAPTLNTSGVFYWPPAERKFAEWSNLWDSTNNLAAGGNMGIGGTPGATTSDIGAVQPSFTLDLSSAELPQDNTLLLRVFYATKHQLDSSGSTIPEVHRDVIVLGACAYAMEAYQVPTNDNFDFQDGGLRDRVDDTKIPQSWLAATKSKMAQFEARLVEIRNQRDFAYSARIKWGDVPARWPRL